MRRSALPVLLALAIVLAGCNGLALGGGETPAPTVTPAPVPTDEPTPTPVPQLAPGLTGEGVVDAFALAEAHSSVLDNTSYTRYVNSTVRYVNGTVYNQFTSRAQYAANDSRFYTMQNGFGVAVRGSGGLSRWSNGERVIVAETRNNSTSYTVRRNVNGEPIPPQELSFGTNEEQIASIFSSVETRIAGRMTRNGTTLYRVVATNVTNRGAFGNAMWQSPRNITLRALISSQGFVREYRLNYTATLDNSTVRVHRRVRYTALGNTTVERPPWYDEAIENVSTATQTTG
jgi:hypothetical protein